MLARVNRLPSSHIALLMRSGHRIQFEGLTLLYRKQEVSQFACIVSSSVDKRAVVRNRIKRLIMESIRSRSSISPSLAGIFIASKSLIGLSQPEMNRRIQNVFARIQ